MKERITIDVDIPDPLYTGQFKNVFHRVLYSDSALDFDFKAAFHGLACVFSDCNAVISFKFTS